MKFNLEEIESLIEKKMVTARKHPDMDLWVLNYTDECAYSRSWSDVTMNCRGTIINGRGDIIARGPRKFFNTFEPEAADIVKKIHKGTTLTATDKADGSLIVVYAHNFFHDIDCATRGSFESDQAEVSRKLLSSYNFSAKNIEGVWPMTPNFELVGPSNPIVWRYDADELVLLGLTDPAGTMVSTGYDAAKLLKWEYNFVEKFVGTLEELNALSQTRPEGLVIQVDNELVKVKREEYVRLSRILANMTERRVWENLSQEVDFDVTTLPEEWRDWYLDTEANLRRDYKFVLDGAKLALQKVTAEGDFADRKKLASNILASYRDMSTLLFMLVDGKDPTQYIWKTIRPNGE